MDLREKIKNLSSEQLNLLLERVKKIDDTVQIPRRVDQRFPLSYGQQRIWFQSELQARGAAFNNAVAFVIKVVQPIDLHLLKNTVNETIQKNEILRTVFDSEGRHPFQRILERVWIDIGYVDLRSLAIEERMSKATELAEQEASRPFDLKQGPLVRFSVFQTQELEYILLTSCHHLISDGWSNNLFFMEMAKGFFLIAKENLPVPQYLEFVSWEKKRFQGEFLEHLLDFWKAYLSGDLPSTRFPQEGVKESQLENRCSQKSRVIDRKLARKVRRFSKDQKMTLFVTLLAAFKALLFRYTGEKDLMIGLPFANRSLLEFQKTMGLFINIILFRTQIDGSATFLDYARSVDATARKVFEYGEIPYNLLVERLNPARKMGADPLFEILYVHQNFPHAYDAPEVTMTPLPMDLGEPQYDFVFFVEEFRDDILLRVKFKQDTFDPYSIDQILDHYLNFLFTAIDNPTTAISHIQYLPPAEVERLISYTYHSDKKQVSDADIPLFLESFQARVKETPERLALRHLDRSYSYQELNEEANRLARFMQSQMKTGSDVKVGLFLDRSDRFVIALLAILKTKSAFVPLDIATPVKRLEYLIVNGQISWVISESGLKSVIESISVPILYYDEIREQFQNELRSNLNLPSSRSDLAYVIFTSGSTGEPKGVLIEQDQLACYIQSIGHEIDPFQAMTFAFSATTAADMGYTNIFYPLAKGFMVEIVPKHISDDPDLFAAHLEANPIDCLKFVPSQLQFLLNAKNQKAMIPHKLLILAGEATPHALIQQVRQLKPDCKTIISYGPTETTIGAMTNSNAEGMPWREFPLLGHPNLHNLVYLLDEKLQLVPAGIPGEICISGRCVARGYIGSPQPASHSFTKNPWFTQGDLRLYRTGDRARYTREGQIEFLGRRDRQVKIRGFRIELGEIEAVLREIKEIDQAICAIHREGITTLLVGFIICKPGKAINGDDVKKYLQNLLPSQMIPSQIICLDRFPLTPSGKADVKALLQQSRVGNRKTFKEPQNHIEATLVNIWKQILKIEALGVDESFFDLGGHSFLALELILKIEEAFGRRLPLAVLFKSSTIQQLAASIQIASANPQETTLAKIRAGSDPRSLYFIHPAGGQVLCYYELAYSFTREFPFYGIQAPFLERAEISTFDTIHKIATRYLDVSALDPSCTKNSVLGGWSLGGIIALEMAKLWQEKTGVHLPVVIVDQPNLKSEVFDDAGYLSRLAKQVEGYTGLQFDISYDRFSTFSFEEQSEIIYRSFVENGIISNSVDRGDFSQFLQLQKVFSKASNEYRPERYEGPVLLIRSRTAHEEEDPSSGWSAICPHLTIQWVEGSHFSMIRPPHVAEVAKTIEAWVNRL